MQNEKFTAGSDSTDYGNHTYNSTQLAGKALFIQYCNRCHPAGKGGKGPSLIDKKPSEFRIHWQVRLGFGPMPSFKKSKISKEQLDQIISFVKLIGKRS